jgi:hypothetical protein
VSADRVAAYRPAPVTQRDGSPLASSNCRMASIATGLDYETGGAKRSTGAAMRTHTADQSGGTDSGDAREAWADGYGESLTVRDGAGWPEALAALAAGHLVHLDVWHAAVGGPCLSGGGAYGHTIAVLPDCAGGSWLVADPWCSPAKWSRVTEAKLRAGAEAWGAEVYGRAREAPEYATGSAGERAAIVERIVRELMTRYHAGGEELVARFSPDTGGQSILFTQTQAREGEAMFPIRIPGGARAGTVAIEGGRELFTLENGATNHAPGDGLEGLAATSAVHDVDEGSPGFLFTGSSGVTYWVRATDCTFTPTATGGGGDVDAALADRDAEWVDALTAEWPVKP